MHPADEYARLKEHIRLLEARAHALRHKFISGDAPLSSGIIEIQVKKQKRRVFIKDRLPDYILREPSLWDEAESDVVTYQSATAGNLRNGDRDAAAIVIDEW